MKMIDMDDWPGRSLGASENTKQSNQDILDYNRNRNKVLKRREVC